MPALNSSACTRRCCHDGLLGHIGIADLAFSPDGHWLAAGGNHFVWVWAMGDARAEPRVRLTASDGVHTVLFDRDSRRIFAVHSGHPTEWWTVDGGQELPRAQLVREFEHAQRSASSFEEHPWEPAYRLIRRGADVAIYRANQLLAWWPGNGYRIAALTPNRYAIHAGGAEVAFIQIDSDSAPAPGLKHSG